MSGPEPADPNYITFDDLLRCSQRHTIISMLIDVNGFVAYDNREVSAN